MDYVTKRAGVSQLHFAIGLCCCIFLTHSKANAEIVSENKFNKNIYIDKKNNIIKISNGVSSKNNLFYSFLKFDVDSNQSVYFIDPGVENIITRVKDRLSTVEGVLGVSGGGANLILINPNGIAFGKNAQLDLKGSFLASTADGINFDDGSTFSVSNSEKDPSLLKINIPVSLHFDDRAAAISNKSIVRVFDTSGSIVSIGLSVSPGKSIALIGGDISMEGGIIGAPGANIDLGSVASNSLVYLNPNLTGWNLNYKKIQNFRDINLSNGAIVQTGRDKGGNINFQGRNINIIDGSEVISSSIGSVPGGNISIFSSESILLENGAEITNGNINSATQISGNIEIKTKSISLLNASRIDSSSDSSSASGNISIMASDLLYLDQQSIITSSKLEGGGKGGNIIISKSGNIILRGDSIIETNATGATADGGNISISASNIVLESSNISANSTNRFGGKVSIAAAGIFQSPDSSITATSALGPQFDGTVNLDVTNTDPTQGVIELPSYISDPNSLIANNPCNRSLDSEFTNIGRGGLPPTLSEDFNSNTAQVSLVEPALDGLGRVQPKAFGAKKTSVASAPSPLTPARGWVFNDKGEVVLVAYNSFLEGPQRLQTTPAGCLIK